MLLQGEKLMQLHPGKTAGTSLSAALCAALCGPEFDRLVDLSIVSRTPAEAKKEEKLGFLFGWYSDETTKAIHLQHGDIETYRKLLGRDYQTYFKVVTIRNPYSRLLSAFFYNKFNKPYSFNEFVQRHLEHDFWLNAEQTINHFGPQHRYVFHEGRIDVDLVIRFEHLHSGVCALSKALGVEVALGKRGPAARSLEDVMKLYDRKSIDVVRNLYREDFRLLQYTP